MIINSLCNKCFQPFKLLVQTSDAGLLSEVTQDDGRSCLCPRLCGGVINLTGDAHGPEGVHLREPLEITAGELYRAVNGLGLPDEIPKDGIVVAALLKSYPVEDVVTHEFRGGLYLEELRLKGGVTIHLTSGAVGARILKITKEKPNGPVNSG
jgi:hypothetical protein